MKTLLAFTLLLASCSCAAFAGIIEVRHPEAPQYLNYDGSTYCSDSESYPRIDELEKLFYKKNFSSQPLEYRLSRLEKNVFGATQSGNLNDRVDKLARASSILNTEIAPWQAYDIKEDSSGVKVKRGLANLGNLLFGGQVTGFTPPVTQDPYYSQYSNYPTQTNSQGYNNYSSNYGPVYTPMQSNKQFGTLPYLPQYSNAGFGTIGGKYSDIYSAGSGDEYYSKNGQYRKDLKTTGAGSGIQIIY